jgi:beta-N-acetylhexosaminidase
MDAATLQADAQTWGKQLHAAGVNLNLAPVLDTVDPATAAANAPIGALDREYGSTPDAVAQAGEAFIGGMHAAHEAVAIKHFPGLGYVTGNTDFTAQGITDSVTTTDDRFLGSFRAGIDAGAEFVMVSLATYTQLDPDSPAVFSRRIITDILRIQLRFPGVVISDDVGAAAAVAAYAPGDRAVRFLRAGGDMVLTIQPTDIAQMTQAVLAAMQQDGGFQAQIMASVRRVLTAKEHAGLLPCSGDRAP